MMSEHAGFGFMTVARAVKGSNWDRSAVAGACRDSVTCGHGAAHEP